MWLEWLYTHVLMPDSDNLLDLVDFHGNRFDDVLTIAVGYHVKSTIVSSLARSVRRCCSHEWIDVD